MKTKTVSEAEEMIPVKIYVRKGTKGRGRYWTTIEIPKTMLDCLRDLARVQHRSLGNMLERALMRKIRAEERERAAV